jgi:hypothetical protein
MATTTMVKVSCGRCAGTGHYGGTIAAGICFGCRGAGHLLITAAEFIAQRKREQAVKTRQATRVQTRMAELRRREGLVRLALDDLAEALDREGVPGPNDDLRRFTAWDAMNTGTTEDFIWEEQGDGAGIDWVRELWIRRSARAAAELAWV